MMKKNKLDNKVALLLGLAVLAAALAAGPSTTPAVAAAEKVPIPSLVVDGRLVETASPLLWDEGTVLVSLRELSAYLEANC